MAIFTRTRANAVEEVDWLHWLFVRDDRAISCDVEQRGDVYAVSVSPLWGAAEGTVQTFARPADALRWHAEITTHLQASGWLLAEGGPVAAAT